MVKDKISLEKLFSDLQTELFSKLEVDRSIPHPTVKGEETELDWLGFLESLPSRYQVNKGLVIDAKGNLSDQIDAIIYDRHYSPLILQRKSTLYIPAESVYAVFEIKPNLSKENIEYAGAKAKSVRVLKRTNVPVRQIDGSFRQRSLLPIISGILTSRSDWKLPQEKSLKSALSLLDTNSRLDLGIALKGASFYCSYINGSKLELAISRPEQALIGFYINLLKQLQLLGNAPAIDFDAYYKTNLLKK